uniref:Uncharacterized protein n=1 Tax=Arion vulgaris TaxID=1028688 RepID=A0A0B6Y9U0_9EUPU
MRQLKDLHKKAPELTASPLNLTEGSKDTYQSGIQMCMKPLNSQQLPTSSYPKVRQNPTSHHLKSLHKTL